MNDFKEPLANFKKEDWKPQVLIHLLMFSTLLVIGFILFSSLYDVSHSQPKAESSKDNPVLTMLAFMIGPIIIIAGKLIDRRKPKTRYNSEGKLV